MCIYSVDPYQRPYCTQGYWYSSHVSYLFLWLARLLHCSQSFFPIVSDVSVLSVVSSQSPNSLVSRARGQSSYRSNSFRPLWAWQTRHHFWRNIFRHIVETPMSRSTEPIIPWRRKKTADHLAYLVSFMPERFSMNTTVEVSCMSRV